MVRSVTCVGNAARKLVDEGGGRADAGDIDQVGASRVLDAAIHAGLLYFMSALHARLALVENCTYCASGEVRDTGLTRDESAQSGDGEEGEAHSECGELSE